MANSGVKKWKLNLVQIIFLLETTTVTTYVHKESITQLASPKKIVGLKNCMFSGTNNTVIKCLNFSENSGRVYIISVSGRSDTIIFVFQEW